MDFILDKFPRIGADKGMSSTPDKPASEQAQNKARAKPVWAEGLRRMYDEVVDEKIPDDFEALLRKLDNSGDAA